MKAVDWIYVKLAFDICDRADDFFRIFITHHPGKGGIYFDKPAFHTALEKTLHRVFIKAPVGLLIFLQALIFLFRGGGPAFPGSAFPAQIFDLRTVIFDLRTVIFDFPAEVGDVLFLVLHSSILSVPSRRRHSLLTYVPILLTGVKWNGSFFLKNRG